MINWITNKDEALIHKTDGQLIAGIWRKMHKTKEMGFYGVIYGDYPDVHKIVLWESDLKLLKSKLEALIT